MPRIGVFVIAEKIPPDHGCEFWRNPNIGRNLERDRAPAVKAIAICAADKANPIRLKVNPSLAAVGLDKIIVGNAIRRLYAFDRLPCGGDGSSPRVVLKQIGLFGYPISPRACCRHFIRYNVLIICQRVRIKNASNRLFSRRRRVSRSVCAFNRGDNGNLNVI